MQSATHFRFSDLSRSIISHRPRPARNIRIVNALPEPQADEDPEKNKREQENRSNSAKGASFTNNMRRRGRSAHLRSPDDSPLRDGNRDVLMGVLTDRASRTLLYYFSETNLHLHLWFQIYMQKNPIPRSGSWDDVSGETFLRNLLAAPVDWAKWDIGRDPVFDCVRGIAVDPRDIAQRIMQIRAQLAKEFIEELKTVESENITIMRDALTLQMRVLDEEPTVGAAAAPKSDKSDKSDKKEDDKGKGGETKA